MAVLLLKTFLRKALNGFLQRSLAQVDGRRLNSRGLNTDANLIGYPNDALNQLGIALRELSSSVKRVVLHAYSEGQAHCYCHGDRGRLKGAYAYNEWSATWRYDVQAC